MIAMFSDIYYYNDKKTIEADTFYNPEAWKKFEAWKAENANAKK